MNKKELYQKAEREEFTLNKHSMGERTVNRFRYINDELVYSPYKYNKVMLTIKFDGEDGEYRINKKDYKILKYYKLNKPL